VIAKTGNAGFVVSGATPYWKHNPYAGTHLHPGKRYHGAWSGTGPYTHIGGSLRTTGPLDYYKGFFGSVDFSEELGAAASATDTPEAAQKRLTLKSLYNQLSVIISNQRRS
jgi:hypothetical protein